MRSVLAAALVAVLLLSGAIASSISTAQAESRPAAPRPLVYVVVIDGLDGDRIEAGRAPFISSLLAGEDARATYFPHSSSVITSETNTNHTAMMSGAYPDRSGLPANFFGIYAPLESEEACVRAGPFDYRSLPTETSGESATCPQAEFVFESVKRQAGKHRPTSAAVFGKPKLGRIFAGQEVKPGRRDVDHLWAPCDSAPDDDAYCEEVPTNPVTGYALDDNTVMDEVIQTIQDGIEAGGRMQRPDFTFVNLHQLDSAGHGTTTEGLYNLAIALADDEIERLVSTLRARGEWERTVLVVLSDHSMDTTPWRVSLTSRFTQAGIAEGDFLAVDNGSADLVYLGDRRDPDRFELLERMRAVAMATPGVREALYRERNPLDDGSAHTIDGVHPSWHAAGRRSGDLLVISRKGYNFTEPDLTSNPLPGNHGGPQTADNFLAIVGGGELVRQGIVSNPARRAGGAVNVDIAPTVMGLFGLFEPAESSGRFLHQAFRRGVLRTVARPRRPHLRAQATAGRVRAQGPGSRKRVKQLSWRPKGGRYDLQVRSGGRWLKLLRRSPRERLRVRGTEGRKRAFRVRSYSAANIESRWRRKRIRF